MGPDESRGKAGGTGFDWLMQIAYLAGKSLDLNEALPATVAAMAELIPCEHVVVLQLENDVMEVRAEWSRPGARATIDKCGFKRTPGTSLCDLDVLHAAGGNAVLGFGVVVKIGQGLNVAAARRVEHIKVT